MNPNSKPVTAAQAKQLRELSEAAEAAQEAYRQGVADALKAGAGVRAIARLTGLSSNTVSLWGAQRGWPTAAQKRVETERKARKAAWDAITDSVLDD